MAVSMTIRDVPAETRDALAARAARAGQSLQEYVRAQLIGLAEQPDPQEFWDRVRHRAPGDGHAGAGRRRAGGAGRRPPVTIVVDASAVVVALIDDGPDGEWARATVAGESLVAPSHLQVEVSSVLRRAVVGGRIAPEVAALAHQDLVDLRLTSFPFHGLAARVWALHPNVMPYDAAYVALAEELSVPLVTLDRRLARATGPTCRLLTPPGE